MRFLFCVLMCMIGMWGGELKILAAANLKNVLEEIKEEFLTLYPQEKILITYLSSGKAYAQIKSGIDVDLFFSADLAKPQALSQEGYALLQPQIYALGKLVLCTAGELNISSASVLKSPKVKHIALANPKLAPYGEAAEEFLHSMGIYSEVKSKLVYGDSIGAALNFVKGGNAEVGLNALSLVIGDRSFSYLLLDPSMYSPIQQAFIILKNTKNESLSRAFARFVMSNDAQKIFVRYGYERGQ